MEEALNLVDNYKVVISENIQTTNQDKIGVAFLFEKIKG